MLKKDLKFILRRTAKYINKKRFKRLDLKKERIVYLRKKNIKTKQSSNKLNYIKLELFKIIEKLELVMFKLELLIYIRIYLVFHILLLKKVLKNVKRELVYINKKM